ncbi:hypothetical protein MPTK1_5g17800 [Marchantia polymorpha subsp. ruderalis]|uniref:AB hydrolase-1 domain-containing protein n=3 Tax=Marchantia polymorpha TaxID=3197 RepID=A0AAF6BJG7_MARPO|nr:hypothetical protein MARPO_0084s0030 [Marchantia polymorpha]BBN12151.1 hypothetical protein Mp_5g17800 [Marchantia polymorpha subsp. ruderalis]|eukprot:PTQ33940.1 hypothetical protein MARPO_0084s0030 [Marchantia polymorpha]
MAMGPCLPCSWVKWKLKLLEMHYRRLGMEPRLIELDDGATVIHCWVPREIPSEKVADESAVQKPALLLLQGFGMDGFTGWEHQTHAFVKRFRVYVPDLLFFGKSFTTTSQRSEVFQAECMKKMLDVLNVDQVHVLGTSYGGMVAYRMASNYPKLVNKVVICSSGIMMDHTTNNRLMELCKIDSVKEILVPKDLKHMRLGMSTATVWRIWAIPSFVLQDMYEWFYQGHMKEKEELVDGMVIGSAGAPPIPKITQEVLIMWGTKDNIFDPALAEALRKHLGDRAQLHMIEGCGHVPQIENPTEFNARAIKFLLA